MKKLVFRAAKGNLGGLICLFNAQAHDCMLDGYCTSCKHLIVDWWTLSALFGTEPVLLSCLFTVSQDHGVPAYFMLQLHRYVLGACAFTEVLQKFSSTTSIPLLAWPRLPSSQRTSSPSKTTSATRTAYSLCVVPASQLPLDCLHFAVQVGYGGVTMLYPLQLLKLSAKTLAWSGSSTVTEDIWRCRLSRIQRTTLLLN